MKQDSCDVGTEAWKIREQEKEMEIQARRRTAAAAAKLEDEETRIIVASRREKTELQGLYAKVQWLEEQMSGAYRQGKERKADILLWEITKIKREIEVMKKNGKK